ncbi:MAG: Peptidyl-prolyl cis-trans isomerase C [Deltaproteobacteria bacterium ADurb.Bin510]|nr:MAG: Peptidyl-prolyl cis-trans isomerase C [Deltaproteobacteria bacterium ADurb.Bin510]
MATHAGGNQASASGFMGVFARGELPPEVERVVFSLPVRRYSGIIASQRGYHIFYVQRRNPAGLTPFAEAREQVRELLTDKALEAAYAKWLQELRAQYHPEVNWDAINDIKIN